MGSRRGDVRHIAESVFAARTNYDPPGRGRPSLFRNRTERILRVAIASVRGSLAEHRPMERLSRGGKKHRADDASPILRSRGASVADVSATDTRSRCFARANGRCSEAVGDAVPLVR